MFNSSLKTNALEIHKNAVNRYNDSYKRMQDACNSLYEIREHALGEIMAVEVLINTIANKPKEFDKQFGEVKQQMLKFHQTKQYAHKAYKEAAKTGIGILSTVAAGGVIATATPSLAMGIATTFGTASTGTAISTLSGAAAQKAALAWIGRMTGGIATKGIITGAGMGAGQAFLALAGPIGWSVSGASTAISLISLSMKNKKISKEAIEEAKKIMIAREAIRETTEKISYLNHETTILLQELSKQILRAREYQNKNYLLLDEDAQIFLGTLVNNALSLAALLNKNVE